MIGRCLLRARPDRRVHLERLAARLGDPSLVVAAAEIEALHQAESLIRPWLNVEIEGLDEADPGGFVLQLSHLGHHALAGLSLARAGREVLEVVLAPGALDATLPAPSRIGQLSRRLVPPSEGVRRLVISRYLGPAVRAAANGAVVVWPGDAAYGRKGLQAHLLGIPWFFPNGSARCAQLAGCPLRVGHMIRVGPGRHRLWVGPARDVDASGGVDAVMHSFVADLDRRVRERPELYLWRMATMLAFGDGLGWTGSFHGRTRRPGRSAARVREPTVVPRP